MKPSIKGHKVFIAMKASTKTTSIIVAFFFGSWLLHLVPSIGPLLSFVYAMWFTLTVLHFVLGSK